MDFIKNLLLIFVGSIGIGIGLGIFNLILKKIGQHKERIYSFRVKILIFFIAILLMAFVMCLGYWCTALQYYLIGVGRTVTHPILKWLIPLALPIILVLVFAILATIGITKIMVLVNNKRKTGTVK